MPAILKKNPAAPSLQAQQWKLDGAESVYFARELENIRAVAFETKYEALKALQLVPINNNFDPADASYTYRIYDQVGMAKLISSYAKDFPNADVSAREESVKFFSFGVSYRYNLQEIRASRKQGKQLDQRRAQAAKKAVDLKLDAIAANGEATVGILGLINVANALVYTVPSDGAGASKLFTDKSSLQVLRDLHNMGGAYMSSQTKDIEHPDTMVLPTSVFNYLSTTQVSNLDGSTILKRFLEQAIYVKSVVPWTKLETAGAGSTHRAITYRRDPEVLEFIQSVPFEQFAPEQERMEFTVACHSRCGGVVVYLPLAVQIADGF